MPTGAVIWRANGSIPSASLLSDGQAVSRTTYAALFAVIGTTYGAGDGSTTFNVPNLIERYPAGANSGAGFGRGTTAGTKDHTHTGNSHTHSVTEPGAHSTHVGGGAHSHDSHTTTNLVSNTSTAAGMQTPVTHTVISSHTHDAHSAHSGSATVAATGTTGANEPLFLALVPVVLTGPKTPETADVIAWGGRSDGAIPSGWLLCFGVAVSRTTYADLFAAIGTTFGAGDGSTTFNLPNLIARFARGISSGPGATGGNLNHTHTGPTHAHTVTQAATHSTHATGGAHTHDSHASFNTGTLAATTAVITDPVTHSSQGGHTHNAHPAHSGAAADSSVPGATGTNNPPYIQFQHLIHI